MNIHLCACSDLHEGSIIEVHSSEDGLEKCLGILRLVGCGPGSAAWLPGRELARWVNASPLIAGGPDFDEDWADIRVWAEFLGRVGVSYAELEA